MTAQTTGTSIADTGGYSANCEYGRRERVADAGDHIASCERRRPHLGLRTAATTTQVATARTTTGVAWSYRFRG